MAYAQITKDMAENPDAILHHIYNRGLCLLHMNRPEEALADFQTLSKLRPDSDSGYIAAGIALWWLDRPRESAKIWRKSINTKYTDAAGGVEVPALLFFAASRLFDSSLEMESLDLLRNRWKTKRSKAWPGQIAGFILGKLDEETFLIGNVTDNPVWMKRRLTKAYFWIGLSYYRQGNMKKYKYYLQESLSGHILEPEYYLAKHELQYPTMNSN